ncbi:MAG: RNA methyltransferase [Leptospiraceae bacterium]|nr:RNA methyltransferase [Leptospiraceae bacterium]MCP5499060.1 RNA methyltransferase [Leptospiraceae bacterium]
MDRIIIILEDPIYTGNIGMCCRLIANFGLPPLRIIGQKKEEAPEMEWMAHNALEEINRIEYFSDWKSCLSDLSLCIGTGMIETRDRGPFIEREELPELLRRSPGKFGILFGREDRGLSLEAIGHCNYMLNFRLPGYQPSMNLAQAVCFVLSLLYNSDIRTELIEEVQAPEKNRLYDLSGEIFSLIGMDEFHGKENLAVKRLKSILETRPLSEGDINFLFKFFRNIQRLKPRE